MKRGDRVMLFLEFPCDFAAPLPIALDSLTLEDTPHGPMARNRAETSALLPGFGLPIGTVNCCLVDPAAQGSDSDRNFFSLLTSLRTAAPFPIHVGGTFTVGNDRSQFFFSGTQSGYFSRSIGGRPTDPFFTADHLRRGVEIDQRARELQRDVDSKLLAARSCFGQVSMGSVKAYQPAVVTLFASLEAFFTNGTSDRKSLAKRVARFLANAPLPINVEQWILDAYDKRRGPFAHGRYDIVPSERLRAHRDIEFNYLHEISRLALLGLLTMPRDWQTAYANLSGSRVRQLDVIDAADSELFRSSTVQV